MEYNDIITEIVNGIAKAYNLKCVKTTERGKIYISPNMQHISPRVDYISLIFNKTVTKKRTTYSIAIYPGIYTDLKTKRNNYIICNKYYDNYHGCEVAPVYEIADFKRQIDNYLDFSSDAVKFGNMLKEGYAQN